MLTAALALAPSEANARPRYAARRGVECTLCHVSPSGGGIRNRYGSHVFQRLALPLELGDDDVEPTDTADTTDTTDTTNTTNTTEPDTLDQITTGTGFSGAITEWLTLGADLRGSYLYVAPERSPLPNTEPPTISTLFLMQADLYLAAQLGPHVSLVLDLGAYDGFEAWFLIRAFTSPDAVDLTAKIGRFMPAFGIRDVNHSLFTRAGVGLDAVDRDTGIELTALTGPFSFSLALVNGTFGDTATDTHGSKNRSFEKALVSRAAVRFSLLEALNIQLGSSFYFNDNADAANPLFETSLSDETAERATEGVDELRAGAFFTASLGRFTYLADFVYVRDTFAAPQTPGIHGYASMQQLDIRVLRGLELSAILEFLEPDLDISGDTTLRAGLGLEIFPSAFIELRILGRRTIPKLSPIGDTTELFLFAHAFF